MEDPLGGELSRRFDGSRVSGIVGTLVLLGDVSQIRALVTAFFDLFSATPGKQAGSEGADLAPGVVDVVLALDAPAATGHDPRKRVAIGAPPTVADVEGPGGIG